jgi:diacylglycerol kinase
VGGDCVKLAIDVGSAAVLVLLSQVYVFRHILLTPE